MKIALIILPLFLSLNLFAQTSETDKKTGIKGSSVFQLADNTAKLSPLEKAEIIGKQLRREYYKKNYQVGAYNYKEVHFETAKEALLTSEGEFKALNRKEINKLDVWFENHSVESVVQMQLEVSYMGGLGLEENYIFIPTESYKPVLVINRFYYSE